jgi:hypothetical protein
MTIANSINAFIGNDEVVKSVLSAIENKHSAKCGGLDVKMDKSGSFTASTTCINAADEDSESAAMVEIQGSIYGAGKDSAVLVENIKIVYAG